MRYGPTIILLVTVLLTDAAPVAAQRAGRNELSIFAGVSLGSPETSDPARPRLPLGTVAEGRILLPPIAVTSAIDSSAEFGARYSRSLTDIVSVDGDFSIAPGHELTTRVQFGCPDNRFCIAAPQTAPRPQIAIVVPDRLLTQRVVAYHYGAGVGVDLIRGAVNPVVMAGIGGVTHDAGDLRDTQLTLRVGGALKASVGQLTTRVEVVDVITADHFVTGRSEHDVHVRVGLGVRW